MSPFEVLALLILVGGVLLVAQPLRYLLRVWRALRYRELIALARLRSVAQGVAEFEGRLDLAPIGLTPMSGLEAGYWELIERYSLKTPICHSHGMERRFIVLRAEGQVFVVDAEHSPFAGLRSLLIEPHLRTGYSTTVGRLKAHLDTLFAPAQIRLLRAPSPGNRKRRNTVQPAEPPEVRLAARSLDVGEDILLAGEPVRMFGDLHTIRGASAGELEARVRHFARRWYPKKAEAAAALVREQVNALSRDGGYSVNFLLQPYGQLPIVIRPADDAATLKAHLLDRKVPTLIFTLIVGLVLVGFAGFLVNLGDATEVHMDPAVLALVGVSVAIMFGGFWQILRRASHNLRDRDGF